MARDLARIYALNRRSHCRGLRRGRARIGRLAARWPNILPERFKFEAALSLHWRPTTTAAPRHGGRQKRQHSGRVLRSAKNEVAGLLSFREAPRPMSRIRPHTVHVIARLMRAALVGCTTA